MTCKWMLLAFTVLRVSTAQLIVSRVGVAAHASRISPRNQTKRAVPEPGGTER